MVLVDSHRISPVPWYSGVRLACVSYAYGAVTRYGPSFQRVRLRRADAVCRSYNPGRTEIRPVWAVPRSLATTSGITIVFSSSGYLDVSVHRVSLHTPMYSAQDNRSSTCWVVPFGDPRINGLLHLPAAYRSLSRPSSPVHAKASTMRSCIFPPCAVFQARRSSNALIFARCHLRVASQRPGAQMHSTENHNLSKNVGSG